MGDNVGDSDGVYAEEPMADRLKIKVEIEAEDQEAAEYALDEVLSDFVNNGIGNTLTSARWRASFSVDFPRKELQ